MSLGFLLFCGGPTQLLVTGAVIYAVGHWKQLKAGKDGDRAWRVASAGAKATGLLLMGVAILLAIWHATA